MPRGDMIVLRRDTLANWAAAEVSGPALAAVSVATSPT